MAPETMKYMGLHYMKIAGGSCGSTLHTGPAGVLLLRHSIILSGCVLWVHLAARARAAPQGAACGLQTQLSSLDQWMRVFNVHCVPAFAVVWMAHQAA
jgi:hypothetical protein